MVCAVPVLIDISPDFYTMDPAELASVLLDRSAGRPAANPRGDPRASLWPGRLSPGLIIAACARHGIPLIEDCSQAHGATLGGRKLGTLTEISTFSLYPTKNLGALGDGGVLATDNTELAGRIAALQAI